MKNYNALLFLLLLTACETPAHYFEPAPECQSNIELPENKDPLSPAYQSQLRNQIRDAHPDDYRYFFKTFLVDGTRTYMITNFRNETTCFDIKMLVNKWDKLAGMRRTNGASYPKELYDLQWEIVTLNGEEALVYIDMHSIID